MKSISRALIVAAVLALFIVSCADPGPKLASVHVPPRATVAPTTTSSTTTTTLPAPPSPTIAPAVSPSPDPAPAVPQPEPDPAPAPEAQPGPSIQASSPVAGVRVSQAWLEQLATCESGWPDTSQTWRTGFFGLEAGYPVGGLSWGEQAAWVQRIIDGGGWPSAWGCSTSVPNPY